MKELKIQYNQQALSPEQERFNLLLERIESLNASISERKLMNEEFNAARNKEILPLLQKIKDLKIRQINTLDHLFNTRDFSKNEYRKIREEIIAQIEQVLTGFHLGSNDEDHLFTLLSFHKGVSKDVTQAQYERIELPESEEEGQGEDEPPKSLEELKIAALSKKSFEQMVQSIRSIYIPLVKKLHPDREPDENEKIRKTEILKKLTEAYEKKDLIALLMLQSEYQLKQDEQDKIKDLESYNKILEEQVAQLEEEYSALYAVLGQQQISEKSLKKLIKSRKKELNQYLTEQQQLLDIVFSNPEYLTQYLK